MKHKFVILGDSSADYLKSERERYDLEKQPKSTVVWPIEIEKEADIDWEYTSPDDFYNQISDKKKVFLTSIPSFAIAKNRLVEYAKNNQDILVICLSNKMSGSYSLFATVAKEVKEEFPNINIEVIDSNRYGGAISLLCIEASRYRKTGHSFKETVEYIRLISNRVHQCGVLDDLFFLARKGRINKTAAFMGSMIGIKPMADFCNETGLSKVIGKARGYNKFYKIFPKYIAKTIDLSKKNIFVLSYAQREPQIRKMAEILKDNFQIEDIIISPLSQTNGVNMGPGLAAVYYIGKEDISIDCVKETEILESILNEK